MQAIKLDQCIACRVAIIRLLARKRTYIAHSLSPGSVLVGKCCLWCGQCWASLVGSSDCWVNITTSCLLKSKGATAPRGMAKQESGFGMNMCVETGAQLWARAFRSS